MAAKRVKKPQALFSSICVYICMKSSKVLNEFLGEISIHTQRCGVKGDPKLGNVNLKVDECVETLKSLDSAFLPFQYHVNQVEDEFLVLIRWVWQLCDL